MKLAALVLVAAGCTDGAEPEFPADYASTFTEVRGCRGSTDHDLHRIRVLADPAALAPYQGRTQAFPVGAIVLKEEYDYDDINCASAIVEWTVMVKTAEPANLGWHWQHVTPSRDVATDNEARCINCHTDCGVAPDGYDGTCAMP